MSHAGVTLDHSIEANVKRLSPDFICLRLLSGLIEEERCSNCVGGVHHKKTCSCRLSTLRMAAFALGGRSCVSGVAMRLRTTLALLTCFLVAAAVAEDTTVTVGNLLDGIAANKSGDVGKVGKVSVLLSPFQSSQLNSQGLTLPLS